MNEPSQQLPYGSRLEGNPYDVLTDPALSREQQRVALEDWIQDLLELQTATEESMLSNDNESGAVADQYQRVNDALKIVKERANADQVGVGT